MAGLPVSALVESKRLVRDQDRELLLRVNREEAATLQQRWLDPEVWPCIQV